MFDRIAPVYDAMNRVMTAGLDRRWRRSTARAVVRPGDRVLDACCGTGDLALAGARARAVASTGLDFSERMLERARRKAPRARVGGGRPARAAVRGRRFDAATVGFGVRNVADLERGLARAAARAAARRPAGDPRDHAAARRCCAPFFRLWFDGLVPLLGKVLPGGAAYTYLPASVRRFPGPDELAALHRARGLPRRPLPLLAGGHRRAPRGGGGVSDAARDRASRGAGPRRVPRRARGAARGAPSRRHAGRRPPRRGRTRSRGGKRLRPLLVFLAAPVGERARRSPRASRSSSCTWRRSSTTTSSTARAAPRAARRPGRVHGDGAAVAAGDYLFARAFAELAETGDARAVGILADAVPRARPRRGAAAAPAARPGHDRRGVPRALRAQDREALRGRVPARLAAIRARPLRPRARDRVPDRRRHPRLRGRHAETGKVPGTDLREGTPTLPLLLAAREDDGRPRGARRRPARRRARARRRDRRARAVARRSPSTTPRARGLRSTARSAREELEALTYAVVDRTR